MKKLLSAGLLVGLMVSGASANSILLTAPGDIAVAGAATASMSAQVRAGGTGFEAALLLPGYTPPANQMRLGNYAGNSALMAGDWRNFEIDYASGSGILTFKIDANDDGVFAPDIGGNNNANETLVYDYGTDGYGFKYIDLYYRWGQNSSGQGQVNLTSLMIDGTAQVDIATTTAANGSYQSHQYFGRVGGGYFGDITIKGEFDLTGVRYSDEVPSFQFYLREKGTPTTSVPDGGLTLALLGGAVASLAALRRKLA
jgi:hypothetical protein